ncbi:MAG: hypothetical protein M3Z14_07270 [Candidatus Eremiobacteraeota bacterium]|nr:hypothetical protein [Candidatus Eremiobacteraeota bacterium]
MPNKTLLGRCPVLFALAICVVALTSGCGGGGGTSGGGGGGGMLPPPPGTLTPVGTLSINGGTIGLDDTFSPVDGMTALGGLQGQPIDGVVCANLPIAFHIHTHLSLFVNGQRLAIPDGIGIPDPHPDSPAGYVPGGKCFYHLHSHQTEGVIHIEAPAPAQFTLGQYFDIWGQTLSSSNIAGHAGSVQIYTAQPTSPASLSTGNYTLYAGDPRAIPLLAHEEIVLEVGPPFVTSLPQIDFSAGY